MVALNASSRKIWHPECYERAATDAAQEPLSLPVGTCMNVSVADRIRSGCGPFDRMCGRRAPALGLARLGVIASVGMVIGCGGDASPGAGETDAGGLPVCEERRAPSGPSSTIAADEVRVEAGGAARAIALAPPRSSPLPATSPRPARAPLRRLADASTPLPLGLRILLVTPSEERASYRAPAAALQRIGVPHDVLLSGSDPLDRERLYDPEGGCRYAGVILSHSGLVAEDASGWHSTLSEEEWQLLAEYEQSCGAREVIWYARPAAELGLTESGQFDAEASETATLTAAGAARFSYLVPDGAIPIRNVYGYLSAISDPATTVPWLESSGGDVLAAVHTRADLTEVLALTVDSGPSSMHSQLLEFGIVDWLSRGLFIGKRRIYLAPHIDDVFLASALWSGTGGESTYRMTAGDVGHLRAWRDGLSGRLPPGSSVRIQLAFNGAGALPATYPDQAMVQALLAAESEFFWINHTWDHANLDAASEEMAAEEIRRNCDQAAEWGLRHFSCSDAITPEITGLDNPDAVAGLLAAGVRHVVSDASRTEEDNPSNPGTNPTPNVGRWNPLDPTLLQIPRHPTSIFFDCSTQAEEVGLYNELYRDYWGRDLTYQEILDNDADHALGYLLSYDVDPLMFHQANLRFWNDGGWHSLYTDWIDRLVDRFTAQVRLPIVGLDMNAIAGVMRDREALDQCGVTATWSADRTRIHLESTGACVVPITGLDAPDAGEVETYGGVPTTHVALACDSLDVDVP